MERRVATIAFGRALVCDAVPLARRNANAHEVIRGGCGIAAASIDDGCR
jgi:hypothetical protein